MTVTQETHNAALTLKRSIEKVKGSPPDRIGNTILADPIFECYLDLILKEQVNGQDISPSNKGAED